MTEPATSRNSGRHALAVIVLVVAVIMLRKWPNEAFSILPGFLLGGAFVHLETLLVKSVLMRVLDPLRAWRAFGAVQTVLMVVSIIMLWAHDPAVTNGYMWTFITIVINVLVQLFYVSDQLKTLKKQRTDESGTDNGDENVW